MAYADIADVETRLGFTLETSEAQSVTMFLQDISLMLDQEFKKVGKTSADFDEELLEMFVSRKGVDFYLFLERQGASSISETVGDTSHSVSYSSGTAGNGLFISEKDKRFLGIVSAGSGFISWTLTDKRRIKHD